MTRLAVSRLCLNPNQIHDLNATWSKCTDLTSSSGTTGYPIRSWEISFNPHAQSSGYVQRTKQPGKYNSVLLGSLTWLLKYLGTYGVSITCLIFSRNDKFNSECPILTRILIHALSSPKTEFGLLFSRNRMLYL